MDKYTDKEIEVLHDAKEIIENTSKHMVANIVAAFWVIGYLITAGCVGGMNANISLVEALVLIIAWPIRFGVFLSTELVIHG